MKTPEEVAKEKQEALDKKAELDRIAKEQKEKDQAQNLASAGFNQGYVKPLTEEELEQNRIKFASKYEILGIFRKPFYAVNGATKHYVKVKAEQSEANDPKTGLPIMIYTEEGNECSYYTNLTDSDIAHYKKLY